MNAAPGKCTGAPSAVNQAIVPVSSSGAKSCPSPIAIAEIPCTSPCVSAVARRDIIAISDGCTGRSEEHTSELQSLMRISYAVFCLKTKNIKSPHPTLIPKYAPHDTYYH